jgi:hypothetical protein
MVEGEEGCCPGWVIRLLSLSREALSRIMLSGGRRVKRGPTGLSRMVEERRQDSSERSIRRDRSAIGDIPIEEFRASSQSRKNLEISDLSRRARSREP